MQHVLESTATVQQQQGLVSTIFREYRNRFGLFWRVMLPVIIVSLALSIAGFLFFNFAFPEAKWTFSTSGGVGARSSFISDPASPPNFQPLSSPMSVNTSWGFSGSSYDIGFLWLAMCPLALIIVCYHQGINVTFGEVWRQTRRRIFSILGAGLLLGLTAAGVGIIFVSLAMTGALQFLIQDAPIGLSTSTFLILVGVGVATLYFFVKWSLCNQCIIIENLSVGAAFRRSAELVRGAWGQFFGMYLLLALGTMVFTTLILGLILLLFSTIAFEFAPLHEVLQSGKFFGLFFGGTVSITLPYAPIWAIVIIVTANTLINAVFAPIWAILTTHLYMERAGIPRQDASG